METLPIPHPESDEIARQKKILDGRELSDVLSRAAGGPGTNPAVPEKSWRVSHSYVAHDYSGNPRFSNGWGTEVRDVDAFNDESVKFVLLPDGGSARAMNTYNVVGNSYPLNISKSFQRFDANGKLRDAVTIDFAWNGTYYDSPKVMISKEGEGFRELSGDEELDVKQQIANAFGLHYEFPKWKLQQRQDARFDVKQDTKQKVDHLAAELMLEGITGTELRTALLKQLHPDTNTQDPDAADAFKYAESLDYSPEGRYRRQT